MTELAAISTATSLHLADVDARWRARSSLSRQGFPHGRLIVSLTSYPPRFASLHLTLQCLLAQSLAPDAVELWIAEDDRAALPQSVRRLEQDGLTIRFCEDIRSYKKIVPALRAAPGAFIVTADDDLHYPEDWLFQLAARYLPGTRTIVCHRAHRIRHYPTGTPLPYILWHLNVRAGDAADLFFTGCGGVLYPPGSLHRDALDEEAFLRLCPSADDIWLYWMAKRAGSAIRKVPGRHHIYHWPGSQVQALHHLNVIGGANQRQLRAMIAAYGYPPAPETAPDKEPSVWLELAARFMAADSLDAMRRSARPRF